MDKKLLIQLYEKDIECILPVSRQEQPDKKHQINTVDGIFYTIKPSQYIFNTLELLGFFGLLVCVPIFLYIWSNIYVERIPPLIIIFAIVSSFLFFISVLEYLEAKKIDEKLNHYLLIQKFIRKNNIVPLMMLHDTLPECPVKYRISGFLQYCEHQTRNYTEFNNIQIDNSLYQKILTTPIGELESMSF